MAEPCPIHGPLGVKGDCDNCLQEGKNIIYCDEHGYQHIEANNCIRCAGQGKMSGRIIQAAKAPNPMTGRYPGIVNPR